MPYYQFLILTQPPKENKANKANNMEQSENKNIVDGNGNPLHDGDRVYCHDYDDKNNVARFYGQLYYDENSSTEYKWFVNYDDGEDCVVLDFKLLWKA